MINLNEPPFSNIAEIKMLGTESNFIECNQIFNKYLENISAIPEIVSYSYNEKWGYVIRATYTNIIHESNFEPSKGTFMCWRAPSAKQVIFSIDPVGKASDLE